MSMWLKPLTVKMTLIQLKPSAEAAYGGPGLGFSMHDSFFSSFEPFTVPQSEIWPSFWLLLGGHVPPKISRHVSLFAQVTS